MSLLPGERGRILSWQSPNSKIQVLFERGTLQLFIQGGGFKAMAPGRSSPPGSSLHRSHTHWGEGGNHPPQNRISKHLAGPVEYQDSSSSLPEQGQHSWWWWWPYNRQRGPGAVLRHGNPQSLWGLEQSFPTGHSHRRSFPGRHKKPRGITNCYGSCPASQGVDFPWQADSKSSKGGSVQDSACSLHELQGTSQTLDRA